MKEISSSELRVIQMNILSHIDSFCKNYGIRYFLCGGSMIGAVRHHGYIPWDDDIDIMMLRDDYNMFHEKYKSIDKSCYKLRSSELEDSFPYTFIKIEDSRTLMVENVKNVISIGVNIDLFPIDVIPDDAKLQNKLFQKFNLWMSLMNLKQVKESKSRAWYKNFVLSLSHLCLKHIPISFFINKIKENGIKYDNMESPYCGITIWGYGSREKNLRSNWDDTIMVPFEDITAPIPIGYDDYLTNVYGNYMELPPEEKRVSHHGFKAYWK